MRKILRLLKLNTEASEIIRILSEEQIGTVVSAVRRLRLFQLSLPGLCFLFQPGQWPYAKTPCSEVVC